VTQGQHDGDLQSTSDEVADDYLHNKDTLQRPLYQLLKIFSVTIRAHYERDKCCHNWNVYDISIYCEF